MTLETPQAPAAEERKKDMPALRWWKRLADPHHGNPGALAQLRRCRSTAEAMRVREAVALAVSLGAAKGRGVPDRHVRAAVDLARVLAHVRGDDPRQHPMRAAGWRTFAGDRRESDLAAGERPRLSEGRFRRLLQTGDGEEKVAAFVRLVALLGGTVNVERLAWDFLRWNAPLRGDQVRERWAFTYYGAGSAAPPSTDTDIDPETDG